MSPTPIEDSGEAAATAQVTTHAGSPAGAVTVVGLGLMGRALARALVRSGLKVTVWNRTPRPEAAPGAATAADCAAAISASPLTIICVADQDAVRALVAKPDVRDALTGRVIVNLTTGSPSDAEELAVTVEGAGGRYLAGIIPAFPEGIGAEETGLIFAGDDGLWRTHQGLLRQLGGASWYAGDGLGAPAALDLAVAIGFYHTAFDAFLEAARYAFANGATPDALVRITSDAVAVLQGEITAATDQVVTGNFETEQATIDVHLAAVRLAEAAIISANPMRRPLVSTVADDLTAAQAAGLGGKGFAAVYTTAGSAVEPTGAAPA